MKCRLLVSEGSAWDHVEFSFDGYDHLSLSISLFSFVDELTGMLQSLLKELSAAFDIAGVVGFF